MKIENIISLARRFAAARTKLTGVVDRIRQGQQVALDENRQALRLAVNQANTLQAELAEAIADSPAEFVKPKTVVVDGIRLGLAASKATVEFDDADAVVEAIRRNLKPNLAASLIRVKEAPQKDALANLTDDQLALIGVRRIPGDPNAVCIKPTDSAVDKLVAAMLEDVEASATAGLVA